MRYMTNLCKVYVIMISCTDGDCSNTEIKMIGH